MPEIVARFRLLPALLLLGACGEGEPPASPTAGGVAAEVRDSAGVRIVQNRVPARGFPVYATLTPEPGLQIGSATADRGFPLFDVTGAVTLPDGRVAVANAASFQIRYYAGDGRFVGATGEQGVTRLGTFRRLSALGRARGDTTWTYDLDARRLTLWDGRGNALTAAEAPEDTWVEGRFGDGSFLVVPGWDPALHDRNPTESVRRDPARYLRWWPETGDTAGVGTFPHGELLVVDSDQRGRIVGLPPFGRRTRQAVGPGRFYVGDQETFEIRGHDPDGTLREIIRLDGVDLTLSDELVAAMQERIEYRTTSGEPDTLMSRRFWGAVPETRPAYELLLLDRMGHLWVGEFVVDMGTPRNWIVFAPDGTALGMVEVPEGFRVLEIGPDWVLGVAADARGVEWVRRYGLDRSPTSKASP